MNTARRWSALATLLALWLSTSVSRGEDFQKLNQDNDGGVAAFYWSQAQSQLHLGTVGGQLVSYNLKLNNLQLTIDGKPDKADADRWAVVALAGDGANLFLGGVGASPRSWYFPGARVGKLQVIGPSNDNPIAAVVTDFDGQKTRIAVLSSNQVSIFLGTDLILSDHPIVAGLKEICWTPKQGQPTWLAGHAKGRLDVWDELGAHRRTILLPVDHVQSLQPLGVTSGEIITVDGENLRFWNPHAQTTTSGLLDVSLAQFSEDAALILESHQTRLQFRKPFEATPVKDFLPLERTPSAIGIASKSNTMWAVAALPGATNTSVEVNLLQMDGTKISVAANPPPKNKIQFIASPSGDAENAGRQIAGVEAKKGVLFFETPAPLAAQPKPLAGSTEDKSIQALAYSTDGRFLLALGSRISLYSTADRQLIAQDDIPSEITNPSAYLIGPFNASAAEPAASRLVLGTKKGILYFVDLKVTQQQGNWTLTSTYQGSLDLRDDGQLLGISILQQTLIAMTSGHLYICHLPDLGPSSDPPVVLEKIGVENPIAVAMDAQDVLLRTSQSGLRINRSATGMFKCGYDLALAVPNPNGDRVLTIAKNPVNRTALWTVRNHSLVDSQPVDLKSPGQPVSCLWSADGETLLVAFDDHGSGTLTQFKITAGQTRFAPFLKFPISRAPVRSLSWFYPDQPHTAARIATRLLSVEPQAGKPEILVRTLETLRGPKVKRQPLPTGGPWYAIALQPNNEEAILVNAAGEAWQIERPFLPDLKSLQPRFDDLTGIRIYPPGGDSAPLYAAAWMQFNGNQSSGDALYLGDGNGKLSKWQAGTWTDRPLGAAISCLAADSNNHLLAVGTHPQNATTPSRFLSVWASDLAASITVSSQTQPVVALQFSPGGDLLASIDVSGILRLWKVKPAQSGPADLELVGSFQVPLANAPEGRGTPPDAPMALTWLSIDATRFVLVGTASGSIWWKVVP